MLTELKIRNFAIIDELNVSFGAGLNVITGETGAGKSIIIGAISLLLGDRASSDQIRTSEDAAEVEALFDLTGQEELREKLAGMGCGSENDLVIRRTISRSGRTRVYINGTLATLALLSSLSESLVHICSQHEHQVILHADNHIDILDEFGGLLPSRRSYEVLYSEYQSRKSRLAELRSLNRKKQEREEFLGYQLKEIRDGEIKPGEDAALLEEKKLLSNAQKLMDYASTSYDVLYGREGSVLGALRGALQNIREIKTIDPSLKASPEDLDAVFFQLEDAALALRDYVKRITFDPERLAWIEERIERLGRLKRKYGGTLEGVLMTARDLEAELKTMASVDEEIAALSQEIASRRAVLLEQAGGLSSRRRKAAAEMKEAIEGEIRALRMAEAQFEAVFAEPEQDPEGAPLLTAKGVDGVEFYLSTNVGEALKPLNRIASGGELSRIILAMKKVLARTGSVGTIVFDEVDSGIGGATAEIVGEKLRDVSRHHQVICITHLPQIACFGDSHYLASKIVSGERTNSRMEILSDEERLREVTRMLGGVEVTDKTRDHAREMLEKRHRAKGKRFKERN